MVENDRSTKATSGAGSGPTPARKRERRDPRATREALLSAGSELFAAHGYDGVSVETLAERAGVNKALVSYHFGGKRGLYGAILRETFAELAERVAALEAQASSPPEFLRGLIALFRELAEKRRPNFPAIFLREALSRGLEPEMLTAFLSVIGAVRRMVERGVREGHFRRVDPLQVHFGLIGALAFFFATEPMRREVVAHNKLPLRFPTPEAFTRYIEELTLRGLAPVPDPPAARRGRAHRKGA